MEFAAFSHVYILVLAPLLAALYGYGLWRKRRTLAAFAEHAAAGHLLAGFSRRRQWLRALCLSAAVAFLALALMQPQWGRSEEGVGRRGRDLLVLLDVSLSMLAEDAAPNRLEHARASIKKLVERVRQEGGHRLGLIAFAGRASLLCPLTLDYDFFLQRLAEANVESVPRKGSLIGDAIRQALEGFGALEHEYTDLILLSDGEDHDSLPQDAAQLAKARGVSLYTVGIGDHAVGAPIPLPNDGEQVVYVRYQDQEVRSRLRQSLLLELAQLTGGVYLAAMQEPAALERIYSEHIAPKARRELDAGSDQQLAHRYYWFVLAALALLIIEMLLPERRSTENS